MIPDIYEHGSDMFYPTESIDSVRVLNYVHHNRTIMYTITVSVNNSTVLFRHSFHGLPAPSRISDERELSVEFIASK